MTPAWSALVRVPQRSFDRLCLAMNKPQPKPLKPPLAGWKAGGPAKVPLDLT